MSGGYRPLMQADDQPASSNINDSDSDTDDDHLPSHHNRHEPSSALDSRGAFFTHPPVLRLLSVFLLVSVVVLVAVSLARPMFWEDVRILLLRLLLFPQDCVSLAAAGFSTSTEPHASPSATSSPLPTPSSSSLSSAFPNYTVIAPWADRWPPPDDDLRCVVVTLWGGTSASLAEEFQDNWPGKEQNFFVPLKNHTDHVIFYTVWPHNAHQQLTDFANGFGWKRLEGDARSIIPFVKRRGNFTLRSEGDEYVTPQGVRVLLFPIIGGFPEWLLNDAGLLERPDWLACAKQRWSVEYALYSGAMFNAQILSHPLLSAYDYYMKMDLDIRFMKEVPFSPFHVMQERGCVLFHTQWIKEDLFHDEDCSADIDLSALEWAAAHNITPAALGRGWFHGTRGYMSAASQHAPHISPALSSGLVILLTCTVCARGRYGNLIGGWLGFLRSPENLSLLRHLHDSPRYSGYYQHRWTDQPAYAVMLGMWYDISDEEARGEVRTPYICDYIGWRYDQVFNHY